MPPSHADAGSKKPDVTKPPAASKGTWMDSWKAKAAGPARKALAALPGPGRATSAEAEAGSARLVPGRSHGVQFPVIYKFNEGYTNAVKRPLLIRELL